MSSTPKTCPTCGQPLASDAPRGLCPACLVGQMVMPGPAADDGGDSAPALPASVRYFGDYELLEEIGRGGMGVIYKARQTSLNRLVALKMILSGHLADEKEVKRFQNEAEAAARLDHPNIVPIYEVGEHDGRHYFAMKLVEGGSLNNRSSRREEAQTTGNLDDEKKSVPPHVGCFEPKEAARLVATIARAVHYAHQRGVLHRDLKPANVLLDAQGQSLVTDFGLARQLESASGLTHSGAILGTPNYMAPEQAAGKQLTTAADVYSLGAILFHLITGRPPFQAPTPLETLRQVADEEPPRPRTLNPAVDRDLEIICLKCLEKDLRHRASSAEDLSRQLDHWLNGEPIEWRPVPPWERAKMWAKRRPAIASLIVSMSIVAGVGLAGVLLQWRRAEVNAKLHREQVVQSRASNGVRRMEEGSYFEAFAWLAHALALSGGDSLQEELNRLRIGTLLRQCPKLLQVYPHSNSVISIAVSRDGKRLATGSRDGAVQVWDVATGRRIAPQINPGGPVNHVEFSPDGGRLLAAGPGFKTRVWATESSLPVTPPLEHAGDVYRSHFSPDGTMVVTAGNDEKARLWDASTGSSRSPSMGQNSDGIFSSDFDARFSADGIYLLTVQPRVGGSAHVWRVSSGEQVKDPIQINAGAFLGSGGSTKVSLGLSVNLTSDSIVRGTVTHLMQGNADMVATLSPCGQRMITGLGTAAMKLWNPSKLRWMQTETLHHSGTIFHAGFSADGRWIVTCSADNSARVWDGITGQALTPLLPHSGGVIAAEFSPDGRFLVTAGADGLVRCWELDLNVKAYPHSYALDSAYNAVNLNPMAEMAFVRNRTQACLWGSASVQPLDATLTEARRVVASVFSPDGRLVATGDYGGAVRIWDSTTGKPLTDLLMHHADTIKYRIAFSPDGRLLATASENKLVILDAATGRLTASNLFHQARIDCVAFSPDGQSIVVGCADDVSSAVVCDVATGQPKYQALKQGGWVKHAEFSVNGRLLLTVGGDGSLRVWSADDGRLILGRQKDSAAMVSFATFSPDGRQVATVHTDSSARIWEATSGKPVTPQLIHPVGAFWVFFDPTGKMLATQSEDQCVRLWDAQSGQLMAPPFRHRGSIRAARFSSDSTQLVTSTADLPVQVWELPVERRSVEDLVRLGEALSCRRLDANGSLVPMDPLQAASTLGTARSQYLEDFSSRSTNALSWHLREARYSEMERNSFAAAFHLQRASILAPADLMLQNRLESARRSLTNVNAAALK